MRPLHQRARDANRRYTHAVLVDIDEDTEERDAVIFRGSLCQCRKALKELRREGRQYWIERRPAVYDCLTQRTCDA